MTTEFRPLVRVGAVGTITCDTYLDGLLNAINLLRLSINPNALGTGSDLQLPAALKDKTVEVLNSLNDIYEATPPFTGYISALILRPKCDELSKLLLRLSDPTVDAGGVNCKRLQEEIYVALDAGIHFTLTMQEQFKKECPGLNFTRPI